MNKKRVVEGPCESGGRAKWLKKKFWDALWLFISWALKTLFSLTHRIYGRPTKGLTTSSCQSSVTTRGGTARISSSPRCGAGTPRLTRSNISSCSLPRGVGCCPRSTWLHRASPITGAQKTPVNDPITPLLEIPGARMLIANVYKHCCQILEIT